MNKEFWLTKWEANDIPFHQESINADLMQYFATLQLQPGDHVLVPLCGKTHDIIWLAYQGCHVTGVELSPIACQSFFTELNVKPDVFQEAHFLRYRYKNIDILCGDFFGLTQKDLEPIKAVYDCKALIALPSQMRKKYVNHLINCFGTQVKVLLMVLESSDLVEGPPFMLTQDEINQLYGAVFHIERLKHEKITSIAEHLLQKGCKQMFSTVYLISP